MARKLTLTIIVANLISLVLLTGLLTVLTTDSLISHLFIMPVFAILLFFSLVTKQVGRTLANLVYSAGLLIYLVILVQSYNNAYVTGLFITGGYAFIGTILTVATSGSKKKRPVMQQPPAPIQVYQQPVEEKPVVRTTTQKKAAKKVSKKKKTKKKVAKKVVKKKTAKKPTKKK